MQQAIRRITICAILVLAGPARAESRVTLVEKTDGRGRGSGFMVHRSSDGTEALFLTAAHLRVRPGDLLVQNGQRARITGLVAASNRLDYTLVKARFTSPTTNTPLRVIGDSLPRFGQYQAQGYVTDVVDGLPSGNPYLVSRNGNVDKTRMHSLPYDIRENKKTSPLALWFPLNPMFNPYALPPERVRVKGVVFPEITQGGMSGGPIFDGRGHVAALVSGHDGRPGKHISLGAPTALIVRDIHRHEVSDPLVKDWLKTVTYNNHLAGKPRR